MEMQENNKQVPWHELKNVKIDGIMTRGKDCFCQSPECIYFKDNICTKNGMKIIGTSPCDAVKYARSAWEDFRNDNSK